MIFADGRIYGESELQEVTLHNGTTGYRIDIAIICDSGRNNAKRATHKIRLIGEQARKVAREGVIGQHVTFAGHESNYISSCDCGEDREQRRIDTADMIQFTMHPLDFENPRGPVDVVNYDNENGKHKFRWLNEN